MRMKEIEIGSHSDNEQMGLELGLRMTHRGRRPNVHIMRIYRLTIKVIMSKQVGEPIMKN